MRYCLSICLLLLSLSSTLTADEILYPADFGLKLTQHGQIDLKRLPANILVGNFNGDCYPDIARFENNRVEIYISYGYGFPGKPSGVRYFAQPVKSFRLKNPNRWLDQPSIVVTLLDGSKETIPNHGGCLQMEREDNVFKEYSSPPPRVSEADFQLVWESEPRPYGMNHCAVGDVDNDGIVELCTWYKNSISGDSAWILIYKSIGDDEYELFMEERFYTADPTNPGLSFMLITDIDQNGQKELMYTSQWAYFWEFSAPGVYISRRGCSFPIAVQEIKETDVDQDGVKELSILCVSWSFQPPTYYAVEEFSYKTSVSFGFQGITGFYQDWMDCHLEVGDFDNDGAVDIVSGNAGWVFPGDSIDIQFFRYDTTNIYNFTQYWLQTNLANSCVTPVIGDFDGDGENELFAGGLCPYGGSAFLWEATGLGTGYAPWIDTTSSPNGPNESCFGYIDYLPSITAIHILPGFPDSSMLLLWSYIENGFEPLWYSPLVDCCGYQNPYIYDTDFDEKKSIIAVTWSCSRKLHDWEQTSAGMEEILPSTMLKSFVLFPNYPNPFNDNTVIKFQIKNKSHIILKIFNIYGKDVYSIPDLFVDPGEYTLNWDASNLSSGIYLIVLESSNTRKVQKAILIK